MNKVVLSGKQAKYIELNCGPLSDTIMSGMPCVENSSFRTEMTLEDDWSFSLLISNHLE